MDGVRRHKPDPRVPENGGKPLPAASLPGPGKESQPCFDPFSSLMPALTPKVSQSGLYCKVENSTVFEPGGSGAFLAWALDGIIWPPSVAVVVRRVISSEHQLRCACDVIRAPSSSILTAAVFKPPTPPTP